MRKKHSILFWGAIAIAVAVAIVGVISTDDDEGGNEQPDRIICDPEGPVSQEDCQQDGPPR